MDTRKSARERFFAWCERHCGAPMNALTPAPLGGMEVVEALWPLNDAFRPNFAAFRALPYNEAYGSQADAAIDRFIATGRWGPVAVEAWRVLLERHTQAMTAATVNAVHGNAPMAVPESLPKSALTGAAILWCLYDMQLPYPPEDRSAHVLPDPR